MKAILSKPEWIIMEALWTDGPMFLSEVMDALTGKVDWAYTTCLTYLKKLVKEGFICYRVIRGSRRYEPAVSREDCMLNESRSLLSRMTDNSAVLFVSNMIKEGGLTREDRNELRDLIDQIASEEEGGRE